MNGSTSLSRRKFMGNSGLAAAAMPIAGSMLGEAANATTAAATAADRSSPTVPITLRVNGDEHRLSVDPRMTLLDALRERIGLTGSKKGCDQGQCGACTVHVDGKRSLACLVLAVAVRGRPVTTIEGLEGEHGALHPMQQAFIDNDAFQCGYCTPGQIMSAVAAVHEGHVHDEASIREAMSGNLCRCAAYPNIVRAVEQAAAAMTASAVKAA